MLIRLIPPSPHSAILYGLSFPNVLPLESLGPGAVPPAWSSQLQILTSFLQLDTPTSIHMLDRAVGLVARTREVSMNVPLKEIVVKFIDGRVVNIPMNSDCARVLSGVVLDVKGCRDSESQRDSIEGSACSGSVTSSAEDLPSSPTKSPKLGKHKRQRSLLFSLISSLVPRSLSSSSSASSPPPTAPPPTPLPPLPTGRLTYPAFPQRTSFTSDQVNPERLRQRARAMLIDVWRRHIITALPPQHSPAAGYAEWTLLSMASKVRAELETVRAAEMWSDEFVIGGKRSRGSRHRHTQSEGRNALDFGDRSEDYESERCRAPSPSPGTWDAEDSDRVVYPRRDQADEWGVRYVDYPGSYDNTDIFEVEFNGHNDSLLAEHFTVGDEWDDNEQLTFELSRMSHHVADTDICSSHIADFGLECSDDDNNKVADTAFDMSRIALVPSDVNDGEDSDDSQMSPRTPEDGEELPLTPPVHVLQDTTQLTTYPAPQSSLVSRVTSSRPRPRGASSPRRMSHSSSFLGHSSSSAHDSDFRDAHIDEVIHSHYEHLDRICTALEIVRSRAREEGWRLVKATTIGAKNGWMDAETEGSLELKAKRRAWSSGIKIHAPYPSTFSTSQVWNGHFSALRSPRSPPGLTSSSKRPSRGRGPIVPTGLSLGIPLQSSPLAMYVWSTDSRKPSTSGILNTVHTMETIGGRRPSRVTFADNITNLFPVCEDENEDSFPPVQASAVGFPQAVPPVVSVDEPEVVEGPSDNEDDPFCSQPLRPRTRTTSMYVISPTPTPPSSPVLPVFRPSTPPPSYQAAVGETIPTAPNDGEKGLDASALLLQPLSSLSISPSQPAPSRPQLTCNPPFIPRPRAVSLPSIRPCSNTNKNRRTSLRNEEERYEDLSRTYASPPPEGPLVISATPAPHEQCPRYAHIPLPVPAGKKSMNASILTRTGKEVVFEQGGSEFTVGIEVSLGRVEEGRAVW